ncbi:MAG TPA: hypothetical protein VHB51_01910 [Candidatus Saccharimonadales bacterium]|nr:hypothetical protein [Candidatus Saccharimonadales bacterium]
MKHFRWLSLSVALVAVLALGAPASAATKNNKSSSQTPSKGVVTQAVTQTYNADSSVQNGMIVMLKPKDSGTVVPLNPDNIAAMFGVVVPQGDATIVLTPSEVKQQQVLVATSGKNKVLVSTQNGPIQIGDYITISAIAGVGMKADLHQTEVIGKAAGNFSGTSNVLSSVKLTGSSGKTTSVAIGSVPVDMYITHNPLFQQPADFVPGFLAKAAATVASHPVSVARIYLSVVLLAIAGFLTANMLYSGVRSGMMAVGRNPLSKKSIIKSLLQTVIAGLIVFVAGVLAVYLILKL